MKGKLIVGGVLLTVWLALTVVMLTKTALLGKADNRSQVASITPSVNVVVTIPMLKDIVRRSCEKYVTIKSIINHDVKLGDFQPRPSDVVSIYEADILVKVGAGLDDWVDEVTKDINRPDLTVVDLSRSVGLLDQNGQAVGRDFRLHDLHVDPYYWLAPGNVRDMVMAVQLSIIAKIPEAAKYLERQREAYFADLDNLWSSLDIKLAGASQVKIVAACDGVFYFGRRFDLRIVGRLESMLPIVGEPLAIKRVAKKLLSDNVKIIVTDELSNSESVDQLVEIGGFKRAVFAAAAGGDRASSTYEQLMLNNGTSILSATSQAAE
ncbi:zinc ABC transporter substrate-binding protein [bacterium]|nr:zinc ABC transporter substrate-binding protein [bacterium]